MKALGIHHVAIQTADLDRSIHFYTRILGAELLSRKPFKRREMAWLKVGTMFLELFSVRKDDSLLPWSDFFPGPVHIAFLVPDLDAFLAHAKSQGAELHPSHPEPFTPPVLGAQRMAYLLGPDGEEVEIRTPENA